MILLDANLLVHSHVASFRQHASAKAWLDVETVWIPQPTDTHRIVVGSLLEATVTRASLVPDTHLGVIATERGLVPCSADDRLARFPRLRWESPLRVA
ncbi:MAG: hypothetical protein KGJ25_11770 [Betaproteobacteria bacterium]|nr:hypothetical protein [Betaproteobacteria bacterium]